EPGSEAHSEPRFQSVRSRRFPGAFGAADAGGCGGFNHDGRPTDAAGCGRNPCPGAFGRVTDGAGTCTESSGAALTSNSAVAGISTLAEGVVPSAAEAGDAAIEGAARAVIVEAGAAPRSVDTERSKKMRPPQSITSAVTAM